ncbi:MAG: cobaltochelatase subunit CobN [Clostridium sp.]|uniref:cobaltochelatase subunit CobN n=1 Tax=Clostridium sp. TaxID=1506 RepID=UPI0030738683
MIQSGILAIGVDLVKDQLMDALADIGFINIEFWSKDEITKNNFKDRIEFIKNNFKAIIVGNIMMEVEIDKCISMIKANIEELPIIPIGVESLECGYFNINIEKASEVIRYFTYGGKNNVANALYYIGYNFLELCEEQKIICEKNYKEPIFMPFDGIFYGDNKYFNNLSSYLDWYIKEENPCNYKWIGIITHRNNWNSGNIEVERSLIREFENIGVKVISVFSYASSGEKNEIKNFNEIIREYFSYEGKLLVDGLVNFQMTTAVTDKNKCTSFEEIEKNFKNVDVPVFKPIISYSQNEKSWAENIGGVSMESSWAFTTPEMVGMIEPIIIGCRGERRNYKPIESRIKRFVNRVDKWIELRKTNNSNKRIAIFIHNAPCSGVEATIGLGAGLDVFKSVIDILKELKKNGYSVDRVPKDGKELHKIIMDRKAYHDFRWTSVENIIKSGGVLYEMSMDGENGYLNFYNEFDLETRREMEKYWEVPPGQGMVYENKIIITGINFGNVTVMVQPKRGCYGAKCTGEVCKILHDPSCPPPHQYIATYRYVERIMKSNAVIHVGTGGSLEYLPGKSNALSSRCYPDVVLGNTPNIYVYNAGVGTEGIGAKRRNNALIVDYLPTSFSVNKRNIKLANLIGEYIEAQIINSDQEKFLKTEILDCIKEIDGAEEIVSSKENFDLGVRELKNYLVQSVNNPNAQNLHILGEVPKIEEIIAYIKEYIDGNSYSASLIKEASEDEYVYNTYILEYIEKIIKRSDEMNFDNIKLSDADLLLQLRIEIEEVYNKLICIELEKINLIRALDGKYIEAGLSGLPSEDLKRILPTGRNFYLMDCEKIPTLQAYEVGCELANKLIERYVKDEGRVPEKVAMNMISTDISMRKGEQLSQILHLMGIKPVWDSNGKVVGVKEIPLEELGRQRIDVTIRISGVLRDAYPQAVNLIDKGVVLAASLKEPIEMNFVKKNTLEISEILKSIGKEENLERNSTIRIFGDKPGTYGAGVDLALKASAWKSEEDIAKIFVYFSSYAYGEKLNGDMAKHEFVENVKGADISYDVTNSKRHDILASSFCASVQGAFKNVKKILSGKELKQYHGSAIDKGCSRVMECSEEIIGEMEATFFNPLWKEHVKKRGYEGASELMTRIQTVFDWQSLSMNIKDKDIDRLVNTYVNDDKMAEWFKENNKYAFEEISRRFLELHERKRWNPEKEVLEKLKRKYVMLEGDMEALVGDTLGDMQGGSIEVLNHEDIEQWNKYLKEVEDIFCK